MAIICYQQPITRVEIDEIRGVASQAAIQTLNARGLIAENGKKRCSRSSQTIWNNGLLFTIFRF
nr:SMC-Scp complex subunit ScpB [Holzapfeliella floricola]